MGLELVVVNANGQVTLPAKDRKRYGLKRGTTLRVVGLKDGLLLQKARVVKESIFDKISRIADAKGITHSDLMKMCKEVGKEVYAEEYGAD